MRNDFLGAREELIRADVKSRVRLYRDARVTKARLLLPTTTFFSAYLSHAESSTCSATRPRSGDNDNFLLATGLAQQFRPSFRASSRRDARQYDFVRGATREVARNVNEERASARPRDAVPKISPRRKQTRGDAHEATAIIT